MTKHAWGTVADLEHQLLRLLEARHPGLVTRLALSMEGDTLFLRGEVASEDCRGDAKRLLLGFDGVFKVRNELEVAGFLEPASSDMDDYFATSRPSVDEPAPERSNGDAGDDARLPRKSRARAGVEPRPGQVEVTRYPKIEAAGAVTPGREVQVEVDLKVAAQRDALPISLGTFPADWQEIVVRVQLFAPWAAAMKDDDPTITLSADGTSRPARFRLTVSDHHPAGGPAPVYASFLHGTRVCGYLSVDLAEDSGEHAEGAVEPLVAVAPEVSGPGVSVTIACAGAGPQTWMWTAQVPGGIEQGSEQINLEGGDQAFAEALLRTCPDLEPPAFRRAMAGLGERLWEAAPAQFRVAYARWREKLGSNFPIQFVTDDPHVPWEMMKPSLAGVDHLFFDHPIARWPLKRAGLRRYHLPGGALLSFVPKYDSGRALPSAEAEGRWICANLGATEMPATRAAFLDVLDGKHPSPVGILHFAGHGAIDTGVADGGIDMEDRLVGVGEVNQSSVVLGKQDGTLLVLNACETSAGAKLLGMNTGWGSTVAAREFGGLIAPLWEVQDDVALTMVQSALPPLMRGELTLGASLAAARRAGGDASVSAFAYLAHGDVMARFARS